jgi:hypothetical protein
MPVGFKDWFRSQKYYQVTFIQATTLFILKSEVVPNFLNNKCNLNLDYNMKGHLRG